MQIVRGDADLCSMTRALICDPNREVLAQAGKSDDLRADIGCNPAPTRARRFPASGIGARRNGMVGCIPITGCMADNFLPPLGVHECIHPLAMLIHTRLK